MKQAMLQTLKIAKKEVYLWILFLAMLCLGLLLQTQKANAMVASEVEPGIIELSTTRESGFEVTQFAEKTFRKSKQTWVYFCVAETASMKSNSKEKCFYGLKNEFKDIKKGARLNGVQYGLRHRIQNSKGLIPLSKNAYFYAAFVVRPQI